MTNRHNNTDRKVQHMDNHYDTSMDRSDIPNKNRNNNHSNSNHPSTRDHKHHIGNDISPDNHIHYIDQYKQKALHHNILYLYLPPCIPHQNPQRLHPVVRLHFLKDDAQQLQIEYSRMTGKNLLELL